jgi:predicted nucleic acid-binding protein
VKTRVLDSWAILEWMSGRQPATARVGKLMAEAETGQTRLLMSAINVGEVYYFLMKHHSQDPAESWRESSPTLPATIEAPTAEESGARRRSGADSRSPARTRSLPRWPRNTIVRW